MAVAESKQYKKMQFIRQVKQIYQKETEALPRHVDMFIKALCSQINSRRRSVVFSYATGIMMEKLTISQKKPEYFFFGIY